MRIHDDDEADGAAKALKALAFTRGNDIYFSAGTYDPVTEPGRRLLAHELTHVVQQAPGINRKVAPGSGDVVRRAPGDKGKAADKPGDKPKAAGTMTKVKVPDDLADLDDATKAKAAAGPAGVIDTAGATVTLDQVYVPSFKLAFHNKGAIKWNRAERGDAYRDSWKGAASKAMYPQIKAKATQEKQTAEPYFLQWQSKLLVFGSAEDIGVALSQMPWDNANPAKAHRYDVDHQQEFQLGGPENDVSNLWLLDSSINRGSGPAINNSIRRDITDLVTLATPKLAKPPAAAEVLAKYGVTFTAAATGPNPRQKTAAGVWSAALKPGDKWDLADLAKPESVAPLKDMTAANREKVKGSRKALSITTRRGGGSVQTVPFDATSGTIDTSKFFGGWGFKVEKGTYTGGDPPHQGGAEVGSFVISFFKGNGQLNEIERTFPIRSVAGVDYGGMVDTSDIRALGKSLTLKHFSPIDFADLELDFDKGLVGRGLVPKPSIKLLERVQIAVILDGADVGLEATITGGDLALPGPFKVKGGAITLTASKAGLSIDGDIDFEIEKLATGKIGAGGSTKTGLPGFAVTGSLDFDTKMFTKASLGLSYADGKWGVKGGLAVGPDKIKGIKSASATVTVDDDKVDATGEFESSIKGVEKGKVGFKYDPATGMAITGEIELGKGIPGLKGGKLAATVKEGAQGWSLSGAVTIQPDVPGVGGDVTGTYDDGAFLVEANLSYAKGMAKGSVRVGLTNQEVGPDNKPAGPPKDTLLVYGGGEVTLTITPWLAGTVGLQLKRDGSIEVKGKVALPDHFDVFPEKKIEKRIFSIGIDIPIVGVAVAGQRIGIFATIKGGMDIEAGFGPGQLRDLGLEVVYNPDHEDDTKVTGTATFAIPAHAGLKLFVDGGLGVGIPVVSATAGVEIFGELGLAGEASASAKVEWTPGRGVVLDAKGELMVEPKFKFGIDAFVDVSADLLVTSIELYHHVWHLAAFEYGSGLRFGMTFPIHYEESKPFDLAFDQVQWTYPHIDPGELLGGLMKQLVG